MTQALRAPSAARSHADESAAFAQVSSRQHQPPCCADA